MNWISILIITAWAGIADATYLLCKLHQDVRTIRVEKVSDGCRVYYTKGGQDRQMAENKHLNSCQKVLENIRDNLLKAGWTCRDVSQQSEVVSGAQSG